MERRSERPLKSVPKTVMAVLLLSVFIQLSLAYHRLAPGTGTDIGTDISIRAVHLPAAPPAASARLAAFGEPATLSRLLMLWLQAHDNPPGANIPFRNLDYAGLIEWLNLSLCLDPYSAYPLLAAARLYAEVPDTEKSRLMLEFVHKQFLLAPNRRWPWMAHAVYVARHRLQDKPLALRYARALRLHATAPKIPAWATQMEIFIHEDLGDVESARILIGGLLASGRIAPGSNEERFLLHKMRELRRTVF